MVIAGLDTSVAGSLSSRDSMKKMASRAQGEKPVPKWPEIPEILAEFEIPEELKFLSDGVTKFLIYDAGNYSRVTLLSHTLYCITYLLIICSLLLFNQSAADYLLRSLQLTAF